MIRGKWNCHPIEENEQQVFGSCLSYLSEKSFIQTKKEEVKLPFLGSFVVGYSLFLYPYLIRETFVIAPRKRLRMIAAIS